MAEVSAEVEGSLVIIEGGLDDSRVVNLIQTHVTWCRDVTPPGSSHAFDLNSLKTEDVTFWSAWEGDALLGVGALKLLTSTHGEIKSMHTAKTARGRGVGQALVRHILTHAKAHGLERLSLETGSFAAFESARNLYAGHGFNECPPFGAYKLDPNSIFMTRELKGDPA